MSEIHETTTYVPPTNDDWWIARLLAVKAAWAADQERLRVAEARLVEVEQALRIEPYDANDRPEWVHDCDLAVVEAWKRNHPNRQWWWFDPRPYVDAVLTAVLDKGEPPKEEPMDELSDCQHPSEATYWNEFNGVIQCHACGAVTLAYTSAELVDELRRLVGEYGQKGVEQVLATIAVLDKGEPTDE